MVSRPITVRVIKDLSTVFRDVEDAPLSEIISKELTYRHHEIQDIERIEVRFRRRT
jgi:hypothetical protein